MEGANKVDIFYTKFQPTVVMFTYKALKLTYVFLRTVGEDGALAQDVFLNQVQEKCFHVPLITIFGLIVDIFQIFSKFLLALNNVHDSDAKTALILF